MINVFTTFGIEAAILNKPTIFYSLNKNQNFKSNINSINFKLKFMPHFQIIKNKIVRPRNNTELFNLLNSILRGKYEKKFYLQSKSLKKVFL